ncbi:hypothetical protein ACIBHY_53225 [Nonomuraea sp. NPDC050547]|uniref:hypothetical protein n=1 Tax=unclassified Nonomuraea TaxID=2593643 RepID=UPI00378A4673
MQVRRTLPKAVAVVALATALTTAGLGSGAGASSAGASLCKDVVTTNTMVSAACDVGVYGRFRVSGTWCSSGFNCNTVLGDWVYSGAKSTAYHPGGKHFTRWQVITP